MVEARVYTDAYTSLYTSLALHFDYEDVVYVGFTKENLNKLQLLLNNVCRVILKASTREHTDDMHKQLALLKLKPGRTFYRSSRYQRNAYNYNYFCLSKFFEPTDTNKHPMGLANKKNVEVKEL